MNVSDSELMCSLLWKICRRHGWGKFTSKEALVDLALGSSDQGEGKDLVDELLEEPYIWKHSQKGYRVKNDPDSQAQAAYRLKSVCGYTELQIETTLSRFDQAGGFSAYDKDEVLDGLDDW